MYNFQIIFLTALGLFISVHSGGQSLNNPLSRKGIGLIHQPATGWETSMGGPNPAMFETNRISLANPASFGMVRSFAFGLAVRGEQYKYAAGGSSFKDIAGNLEYITFSAGLDSTSKWGLTFGLAPYSEIGYNLSSTSELFGLSVTDRYVGSGGLNRVFLGTGLEVLPRIRLGAEGSYIFGQRTLTVKNYFPDSLALISIQRTTSDVLGGLSFGGGVSYATRESRDVRFQFGLAANFGGNLSNNRTLEVVNFYYSLPSGSEFPQDSLVTKSEKAGRLTLPQSYSGGLRLIIRDTFEFALNAQYQDWRKLDGIDFLEPSSASLNFGLGFGYTPDAGRLLNKKLSSYLARIQYRLALNYGMPAYRSSPSANQIGATLGFGFPLPKKISPRKDWSAVDFSVGYFASKQNETPAYQFNQIRATLGIHLIDPEWFRRRQID